MKLKQKETYQYIAEYFSDNMDQIYDTMLPLTLQLI